MLYRRPNSQNWYCRFEIGGQEIRRSTGTASRKAAAEFENRLRSQAWREIKLGEKCRLFQEAALRWLEEKSDKRSFEDDKSRMRWLLAELKDMDVREIDGDVIADLRKKKRSEFRGKKGKSSGATVNRYMALLRSMLRSMEREWGWISKAPKVPMYPEPDKEIRWLQPDEWPILYAALPPWKAACAGFAIETGLRAGPIKRLEWPQVDLPNCVAFVKISQSKNKKPLRVPLTDNAIAILETCKGQHKHFVFTEDGEPITGEMIDADWKAAVKQAGVPGFRFHDLRHTWATWHVQSGTPLHVLQKLGGWSTLAMVQRYAHLAESDLDTWARKPRSQTGTYMSA